MISVVIPYFEVDPEKRNILKRCVDSLKGCDELIIVNDMERRGPTRAVIQGFAISHGDYIVCVTDDTILTEGSLADLVKEGTVTSPKINGCKQDFWGMVFCVPRTVYEKVGILDPIYDGGIFWDDEDYRRTLLKEGIPMQCVEEVNFHHPEGGRTVNRGNDDIASMKDRNAVLFAEKWGI